MQRLFIAEEGDGFAAVAPLAYYTVTDGDTSNTCLTVVLAKEDEG